MNTVRYDHQSLLLVDIQEFDKVALPIGPIQRHFVSHWDAEICHDLDLFGNEASQGTKEEKVEEEDLLLQTMTKRRRWRRRARTTQTSCSFVLL